MRKSRPIAIGLVFCGVLVAGTVTAISMSTARAATANPCDNEGSNVSCTVTETIDDPVTATISVTTDPSDLAVAITWSADCTLNGDSTTTSGGLDSTSPTTDGVQLGYTNPASCTVTATGALNGTSDSPVTGTIVVTLDYTAASPSPSPSPSASPSPSPTPSASSSAAVSEITGYAGLCLDDTRNSSTDWNKIQIWDCIGDQAQNWDYTGGELVHNGMCANDSGWGGNYSHVILWDCNDAANEVWTHEPNGEYVLAANGGYLCLDDPAYSTQLGRQLIVYQCHDGANQQWSLP
jgi:hypothetical protein